MEILTSEMLKTKLDTLPKCLQYWAETDPDREIFVFYKENIRQPFTVRQVLENAGKFARRLRFDYGFQKGDTIANNLYNSPELLFTDLGIMLAGCTPVNRIMEMSDGSDFQQFAQKAGLSGIVLRPEENVADWRHLKPYVVGGLTSPTVNINYDLFPRLKKAILVSRQPAGGRTPFMEDLLDSKEDIFVESSIQSDDIAFVQTTSGSTGYSKLVPRSHTEFIEDYCSLINVIKQHSKHVFKNLVVFNQWSLGWSGGFPTGSFVAGDTRILWDVFDNPTYKDDLAMWNIIRQEKVNFGTLSLVEFNHNLQENASGPSYKLKINFVVGQPIKKKIISKYTQIADEILVAYASTETNIVSSHILSDPVNIRDFFTGKVLPGVQVRIVDDNGQLCRPEVTGIIHLKGKGVFKGYMNAQVNPDPTTAECFTEDGWFKSDDIGFFDQDNNLYVLGRKLDIITYNTSKVYPGWLEPKLLEHPDVEQAYIVPVSDPLVNQNICAFIKLRHGSNHKADDLKIFYDSRFYSHLEIDYLPIPLYYVILEAFPRTATGKVDRKLLRKLAEETYGCK